MGTKLNMTPEEVQKVRDALAKLGPGRIVNSKRFEFMFSTLDSDRLSELIGNHTVNREMESNLGTMYGCLRDRIRRCGFGKGVAEVTRLELDLKEKRCVLEFLPKVLPKTGDVKTQYHYSHCPHCNSNVEVEIRIEQEDA